MDINKKKTDIVYETQHFRSGLAFGGTGQKEEHKI